jgi:hypothetical protein
LPRSSNSAVLSPKYQTVPFAARAYQSVVRSTSRPPSYTASWTTVQRTPWMTFVLRATVKISRAALPPLTPV